MNVFDIQFIKMEFTIHVNTNGCLPRYKVSMLRGGMGEMLLRQNCYFERNCETCSYENECLVQRTVYTKGKIEPEFVTGKESNGYIIECDDEQKVFHVGDEIKFQMILFDSSFIYFNLYIQAIQLLGMNGMGKDKVKFSICSILNMNRETIFDNHGFHMEQYKMTKVKNYLNQRKQKLAKSQKRRIDFVTPVSLKYHGELLREICIDAMIRAVLRRIYIMENFAGYKAERRDIRDIVIPEMPEHFEYKKERKRYSNRRKQAMPLWGLEGTIKITGVNEEVLDLLLIGELLHIGKNISFDFGRYIVY